jgi:hypothetical protein
MATQRQKAANQKNAQNSPGPATPEGKGTASQNALKHGLLAAKIATLPWEDPAELEQLRAKMQQQWQPQGDLETALVGQMVAALWNLRRLDHVENGVYTFHYLSILEQREKDSAAGFARTQVDEYLASRTAILDKAQHARHQEQAQQIRKRREELLPTLGQAFIEDVRGPDALGKLSRYQTATENSLYRALHELQRQQSARHGSPVPPPVAIDVGVSVSAPEAADLSEKKS